MPPPVDPQAFDFRLERTIRVRHNGVESSGPLTVGPVLWLPELGCWACSWSVHVIHPEEARIYGEDPIQALDRTLWFLMKFIHGHIEEGFSMWWQHEGDACGFGPTEKTGAPTGETDVALRPDPSPGDLLEYRTTPDTPPRFEGQWNHWLFIAFAIIAAANVLAAPAAARSDFGDIFGSFATVAFCAAYVGLWLIGQIAFWTQYPSRPPRFTAAALAAVSLLAIAGLVGNVLFMLML